jgi:hypothetical protein
MKNNILEFSGFLKNIPEGADEKEVEKEDEEAETKFSTKAFKMHVPQLKMLCDFFDVDRSSASGKALDKETLIDRLLDFLGAPDPDLVKGKGEKKKTPKKATSKQTPVKSTKYPTKGGKKISKKSDNTSESEPESDVEEAEEVKPSPDYSKVKEHKKNEKPSDEVLRQWVRAYVVCFNMDAATTKHAIKTASEKFGVDLNTEKDRIKELLAEEM